MSKVFQISHIPSLFQTEVNWIKSPEMVYQVGPSQIITQSVTTTETTAEISTTTIQQPTTETIIVNMF
ncbi:MAG: hypothetical protein HeimC3_53500 [Candidatus Heimdallarchaeota archaeon LC_3]|nr:MAG: hypothetical protein HeimC3_53500 [Candidatus Heimdallarchaeota archaeon LC_3]